MRICFTTIILMFVGQALYAQDLITDRNNNGKPIFMRGSDSESGKRLLFSIGANVSDAAAIKLNIYKHKWGDSARTYTSGSGTVMHTDLVSKGWGAYLNAKNKEGIAKLFKSGNFAPGVTGGGYYAWNFYKTQKDSKRFRTSSASLVLNGDVSFGSYQLYDSKANFGSQLITKNYVSPVIGLSYLLRPSRAAGNVYWGGSVAWARTNTYDDLDNYDIRNDSLITANGINRKVTKINPNGDTYADASGYNVFNEFRIRGSYTYIPSSLEHRFGFTLYPSVFLGGERPARLNTGLSLNYLEDGNPTISVFALNFELVDITNSAASTKPFLKRIFKVGLSTNLNIFGKPK